MGVDQKVRIASDDHCDNILKRPYFPLNGEVTHGHLWGMEYIDQPPFDGASFL